MTATLIGRASRAGRGGWAVYRCVPCISTAFVLAVWAQRERGCRR